jgi:hypothetical protein
MTIVYLLLNLYTHTHGSSPNKQIDPYTNGFTNLNQVEPNL